VQAKLPVNRAMPEPTAGSDLVLQYRRPPPGIDLADDQKSLVLLFDPEAGLLFGSIQAKVMTAIVTRLDLSMV
jgi:hypothetical protein